MITIIHQKLDKLVLSKSFTTLEEREIFNLAVSRAMFLWGQGELGRRVGKYQTIFLKHYPEKTSIYIKFGANKNGAIVWIDFNPSKLDLESWIDFIFLCVELFGENTVYETFKIQLIELAMDVNKPMSDFIFIASGISNQNTLFKDNGTLYLGAKYSNRTFIIYDKQKQLQEKKNKTISYPLTRVEARIRGINITINQLDSLESPFKPLLVIPISKLETLKQDKALYSFTQSLNQGLTGQEAYRQQNKEARKRLLKLLAPHSIKLGHSNKHWLKWLEYKRDLLFTVFTNS